MLYALARPLLFKLEPERAHHLTLNLLKVANQARMLGLLYSSSTSMPTQCMGLTFPNPVGLAAGLDKNGAYIDALATLGFGFIEVGTITPRPQVGNPLPRLFRLPNSQALINRMGFNNAGVDKLVKNVEATRYQGILGINIGKNADTPIERANEDYLTCLERVYPYASYITVNISSPNTRNLRSLQTGDALSDLLDTLKNRQQQLASIHQKYVPLVLKVAPDLTSEDIEFISRQLLHFEMDGLTATNTTLDRQMLVNEPLATEAGGLSGKPVFDKSTLVLKQFARILEDQVPLIGVGGIDSGAAAVQKMNAGAKLIQIYSGLIYRGPHLVTDCNKAISFAGLYDTP